MHHDQYRPAVLSTLGLAILLVGLACLACALSLAVSQRRIPLAAEPLQAASPRPD